MTEAKDKKKKGFLRTEAIVPATLITGAIIGFNILFLDSTIKKSIEFIGEKINGAEVNVGNVNTSFSELKFSVHDIQVTDKTKPENNKIVIGQFNFQMVWDALLRGKVLINKAVLSDVLVQTQRKKPGYVLPDPPPTDEASKKAQELLSKTEKQFEGNVIGDIAGVVGGKGFANAGTKIESDLASKKGFQNLSNEIDSKNAQMKQKLAAVPSKEEINSLQKRIKNIKWNDLGNIAKAPKVLKEIDKLKKDIDKTNKAITEANQAVNSNIKTIDSSYKNAQALVDEDIKNVGKRMNLPTLDPKTIAQMLFGNELINRLKEVQKYQSMAKKYMPPKKEDGQAPIKKSRGQGRDYRFGTPNSYPLFWLKLASIDSKNDQGEISGEIKNITTNQDLIGTLTTARIIADFPKIKIRNIKSEMELDHRGEPILRMKTDVGSYPISDKALSNTKDSKFIIKNASTNSRMKVTATEQNVDLRLNNIFTNINYETSAKSKQVDQILNNVAQRTKKLTLNAKGKGSWDNIKFDINSNLAQAIQRATAQLVQDKINKAKAKIKADVEAQIAKQKKEVDSKINAFKSDYNSKLSEAKNQLAKLKSDLDKQKKSAQKKAKKSGSKLLKGIKGIKF